jgi:hypothetical protein
VGGELKRGDSVGTGTGATPRAVERQQGQGPLTSGQLTTGKLKSDDAGINKTREARAAKGEGLPIKVSLQMSKKEPQKARKEESRGEPAVAPQSDGSRERSKRAGRAWDLDGRADRRQAIHRRRPSVV